MLEYTSNEKKGYAILAAGVAVLGAVLGAQYVLMSQLSVTGEILVTPEQSERLQGQALPAFGLVLTACGMVVAGAAVAVRSWIGLQHAQVRSFIALATDRHRRLLWISASAYLAAFLFMSGTAVYSSERLSDRFGVDIPSYYVTGCCGQPGSFPVVTAYASEHFGLLLVPANIMMAGFLPALVGVNACVMYQRMRTGARQCALNGGKAGLLSSAGVPVTLFAGCPTCAGSALLTLFGTSGAFGTAIATTMSLPAYNIAVMVASTSMLAGMLILNARKH